MLAAGEDDVMKSGLKCAVLAVLLSVPPAALADRACDAGYRDTTPAERAKMTGVLETIRSAMPAPAAGWAIGGDDAISVPQSLCQDFARVPLNYNFTRWYRNVGEAEERQKIAMDQATIEAEAFKKIQPRLEAVQKQMEAVSAKQVALIRKNDFAGAEKYNAEIARLQAEYQRIADEGSNPAALEAAGKAANRDVELTIQILVNPMTLSTPAEAKPTTRPAGATSAYRWHVEDEKQSTDHALFYFGGWFKRPDGKIQPSVRQGAPLSTAHAFTIEVSGDPERVTQTVAAMDYAKLTSVLK